MLELVLGIILDGATMGARSRRIPLPFRIALALLVTVFWGGLGGFMLLCGINLMRNSIAAGLLCLAIGLPCLGYLIWFWRRLWRGLHR